MADERVQLTIEIEEEFVRTWDKVEERYKSWVIKPVFDYLTPMVSLIGQMRERGYDHKFRAWTSHDTLALSRRSTTNIMDIGYPGLRIDIHRDGHMEVVFSKPSGRTPLTLKLEKAEFNAELEEFLGYLLAFPVDYRDLSAWR
jgi:hypothetical protein